MPSTRGQMMRAQIYLKRPPPKAMPVAETPGMAPISSATPPLPASGSAGTLGPASGSDSGSGAPLGAAEPWPAESAAAGDLATPLAILASLARRPSGPAACCGGGCFCASLHLAEALAS